MIDLMANDRLLIIIHRTYAKPIFYCQIYRYLIFLAPRVCIYTHCAKKTK